MRVTIDDLKLGQLPILADDDQLGEARRKKWDKYEAMMISVIAACERHLVIIRDEQRRADAALIARRRDQVVTK